MRRCSVSPNGRLQIFRGLGFRDVAFRVLGFRDLGFRVLGFRDFGFRNCGFRVLGFRMPLPFSLDLVNIFVAHRAVDEELYYNILGQG